MERILLFFVIILCACWAMSCPISAETLDEAWQTAVCMSHRLHAKGHQVEAARAEQQAARAARLPKLSNTTALVALSERPGFQYETPDLDSIVSQLPSGFPSLPPGLSSLFPTFAFDLPLSDQQFAASATTVTVPLYTGGKIQSAINATRHQVRAAHAGYAVSTQELKLEVAEAYFNVLRMRQIRDVAQNTERSLFRHRHDVEKLLNQKMVTKNALLASQTTHAAAVQAVLMAENAVLIAESAYNRYLGRPLDQMVLIEEIPIPSICDDLEYLTREAMRHRKEITVVAAQSQASAALSKVAHADRLPSLVAVGAHSYVENSHLTQESLWSGAIGMRWTPLDGGSSRARQRAAMQTAAAAARMRDETRSLIELQVRAAWTTERETRSRIDVARLGKRQADENVRVVTRQFQEGLVNHTEVLDAQTLQSAAAMSLCNANYDAIIATFRLKHAIGLLY